MVIKTTFGQFRRWSLISGTLGIETEEKNNLNFANKVFNRKDVFILGGLNSGISLYLDVEREWGSGRATQAEGVHRVPYSLDLYSLNLQPGGCQ